MLSSRGTQVQVTDSDFAYNSADSGGALQAFPGVVAAKGTPVPADVSITTTHTDVAPVRKTRVAKSEGDPGDPEDVPSGPVSVDSEASG